MVDFSRVGESKNFIDRTVDSIAPMWDRYVELLQKEAGGNWYKKGGNNLQDILNKASPVAEENLRDMLRDILYDRALQEYENKNYQGDLEPLIRKHQGQHYESPEERINRFGRKVKRNENNRKYR